MEKDNRLSPIQQRANRSKLADVLRAQGLTEPEIKMVMSVLYPNLHKDI